MTKAAYPYTLQPIPYELSKEEQRTAQLSIWRKTNTISKKTWGILAGVILLAILGLIFIKNYSTVICWVMLVGVAIYLLVRKFGLEWYIKRQLDKQPIEDIKGIKMGIQPQGLMMIQKVGLQEGRGMVAWKDVTEWQDNPDFIFMTYQVKGQQGAHILPKRMNSNNFSFETIRKHLRETVGPAK